LQSVCAQALIGGTGVRWWFDSRDPDMHAVAVSLFARAMYAKSLQKTLAMLRDSELQCDLFGCSIK